MSLSYVLRGYVPPYAGNAGKVLVDVTASGAYASEVLRPATITTSLRNGLGPVALRLTDVRALRGLPGDGGFKVMAPNVVVRFGPVTAATHSGTTATVTVATGHNIQTGEQVKLSQVLGATQLNATWGPVNSTTGDPIVKRVSDTVFTISGVSAMSAFSASANSIVEVRRPFAAISLNGFNISTNVFTTSAAHGLAKGDQVIMSQATGLTGAPWLNRVSVVATVPSSTTFTVLNAGTTTGVISGGVVIKVRTLNNFGTIKVTAPRSVAIASITAANPAVYTTGVNHGLVVGDRVFVSGVQGTTLGTANAGYARVRTVPLATTFTLEDEDGLPITTAGASVTNNTGTVFAAEAEYVGTNLNTQLQLEIDLLANNPSDGVFVGPLNA